VRDLICYLICVICVICVDIFSITRYDRSEAEAIQPGETKANKMKKYVVVFLDGRAVETTSHRAALAAVRQRWGISRVYVGESFADTHRGTPCAAFPVYTSRAAAREARKIIDACEGVTREDARVYVVAE
jgi:hypothetical protein